MTLNIIYTANSSQYLLHFLPSLLDYSSHHFLLVSNSCSSKERVILKKTVSQWKRVSYYCYPTNKMQIHGKVLNHLQARCQEKYFCFMDSDIFATAPLPDLIEIMEREKLSALFSCMPLWVKKSEYICKPHFKSMLGTYNQMEDGTCIGSTYFAIYSNEHLTQIMQHYGVPFDECLREQLSPNIQQVLANMGYHQQSFDTGKVINLLMNKHSMKMKNIEISQLCHIGGTSYETTYQAQPLNWKQKIKRIFSQTPLQSGFDWYRNYYFDKRFKYFSKEEYQINYNQRILHRDPTRQHFLKLYLALSNHQEIPKPPIFEDQEITQNVAIAHQQYIENFKKYYNTI